MKYTRAQLQAELAAAFVAKLDALKIDQSGETLMAVFKALLNIAFDCLESGGAPQELVAERLLKLVRRRLPRLKRVLAPWPMKGASA